MISKIKFLNYTSPIGLLNIVPDIGPRDQCDRRFSISEIILKLC